MTIDLNQRVWFNTTTAAEYAGVHPDTVADALRSGELQGSQRKSPGGHWRIHRDALDAWLGGAA